MENKDPSKGEVGQKIIIVGAGKETAQIIELLAKKGIEGIDAGNILTPEMLGNPNVHIPFDPKEEIIKLKKELEPLTLKKIPNYLFEPNNRATRRKKNKKKKRK